MSSSSTSPPSNLIIPVLSPAPTPSIGGLDFLPSVHLATTLAQPCTSLLVIPSEDEYPPFVVCGKDNGETVLFASDFTHRFCKTLPMGSPITALAYGKLCSPNNADLVSIAADGQLQILRLMLHAESISLVAQTTQLVHANITAAYIGDVNKDEQNELVVFMTDRVVRTFRWCPDNSRLFPLFKWEVPAQIASVAIGESVARQMEAWLSQAGTRSYVAIQFSGENNVTVCDNRKDVSAMIMPYRTDFVTILGSLVTGIVVHVSQKDRRLKSLGGDVVAIASLRLSTKMIIVTVDVNALCLLYAFSERSVKKTEIDPLMRMTVLRDTIHVAAFTSSDSLFIAVSTKRGRVANYGVPMDTIDHRFMKIGS